MDESGRSVSTIPSQSPRDTGSANETSSSTSATPTAAQSEPIAGTSSSSSATDANVPQVSVTDDSEGKLWANWFDLFFLIR